MTGKLTVIGLGPGSAGQLTPEAAEALRAADVLFGYGPYLDRVPERVGQRRRASNNRQEIDRASQALMDAAGGASVAVVSGGDPGIFAMAAAVCEAPDDDARWNGPTLHSTPPTTSRLNASKPRATTAVSATAAKRRPPLLDSVCSRPSPRTAKSATEGRRTTT